MAASSTLMAALHPRGSISYKWKWPPVLRHSLNTHSKCFPCQITPVRSSAALNWSPPCCKALMAPRSCQQSKASEHVSYCNQRAAPPFRSARSGLPLPESHTGQLSSVPMLCHPDEAAAAHHGRPGARPKVHAAYGSRPDPAADQRLPSRWQGRTSGTVC